MKYHISSDILGPLNSEEFREPHKNQKFFILTITDRCSRWTEIFKLNEITPESIIKHFIIWISRHGSPETVLSDQGRQYTIKKYQEFSKTNGIKSKLTTVANPIRSKNLQRIKRRTIQTKTSEPQNSEMLSNRITTEKKYSGSNSTNVTEQTRSGKQKLKRSSTTNDGNF